MQTNWIFMTSPKKRVLIEMRPALEGFAGIPQEVRLLFRGLRKLDGIDVGGCCKLRTVSCRAG